MNTGDQDLSGLATKTALTDSTAKVRSEIPDVSGFLSSETDPTYTASQAAKITATDITNLANLSGVNTGDQDLSGLATKTALKDSTAKVRSEIPDVSGFLSSETDPAYTASQAAKITATDITNLANLSGVNTGDQDLSGLATKTALKDSTAKVRSEIPDVSGFLSSETDPAYTASQAAKITSTDITNLANLSGVNTGDQDLSDLALKTEVTTALNSKVDKETGKGLSTNDYTTDEKNKLAGVATGAEANVNADWNATSGDAQILNKPTIPAAADGSETKVTAGTNITVTGAGTSASPYVVNQKTLTIGQAYQGGIIFWLDATGQHGLIAATVDQSVGYTMVWSNGITVPQGMDYMQEQ